MKLNGWQRLWVVVVGILLLAAISWIYVLWPTSTDVSKMEVYTRIPTADAERLERPNDDESSLTPTPGEGAVVDIDGHLVRFKRDVPLGDTAMHDSPANQTARAYDHVLQRRLRGRRASLVGGAFGVWVAVSIGFYLLGWAIGWVRQGFIETSTGLSS